LLGPELRCSPVHRGCAGKRLRDCAFTGSALAADEPRTMSLITRFHEYGLQPCNSLARIFPCRSNRNPAMHQHPSTAPSSIPQHRPLPFPSLSTSFISPFLSSAASQRLFPCHCGKYFVILPPMASGTRSLSPHIMSYFRTGDGSVHQLVPSTPFSLSILGSRKPGY
jgi:hypothetical protein